MRRKHPSLVFVPELEEVEVKMPKPLVPINWEERYGASNVRYDNVPIYDEDGNYIKTVTDVYVTMEKVMGYRIFKRQQKMKDKPNYKMKKLFKTSADILEEEKEEEEKEKEKENDRK